MHGESPLRITSMCHANLCKSPSNCGPPPHPKSLFHLLFLPLSPTCALSSYLSPKFLLSLSLSVRHWLGPTCFKPHCVNGANNGKIKAGRSRRPGLMSCARPSSHPFCLFIPPISRPIRHIPLTSGPICHFIPPISRPIRHIPPISRPAVPQPLCRNSASPCPQSVTSSPYIRCHWYTQSGGYYLQLITIFFLPPSFPFSSSSFASITSVFYSTP